MTNDEYARLQEMWLNATGVKEGSWVKVARAAKSHESGWNNSWMSEMNALVGRTVRVKDNRFAQGICLAISEHSSPFYAFPFFVLEPAEELKPEKYRFEPFERVLMRDTDDEAWRANVFGRYIKDSRFPHECVNNAWKQCIPYAGHEHLLGTSDEPEDWEKYYDKE
ncbi:hypothetical protein [Pyramidobacter sp. C12-8]|uniref:hypothetical protein n=1 Tax=Pyramidobacter sp. C12-8 TaxID=1943580 RepID=UPI00098EF9FC|nr:hypothetical protein [Pyramidobacter sp. C12-8]OON89733.1 hypothetical protein B0D78_02585 [Pyramidobacter sp. C12-8]